MFPHTFLLSLVLLSLHTVTYTEAAGPVHSLGPVGTDAGGILNQDGVAAAVSATLYVLSDLRGDLLPLISTLQHVGIAKVATQSPPRSAADCAFWHQNWISPDKKGTMTLESLKKYVKTDTAMAARECVTWTGEKAVLVMAGGLVDGGPHGKSMVHFLLALREQARAAGGDIVLILGNTDLASLSPKAKGQRQSWLDLAQFAKDDAQLDAVHKAMQSDFTAPMDDKLANALRALRAAWLRENYRIKPLAAAKIGPYLFTHAGLISQGGIGSSVVELNAYLRRNLDALHQADISSAPYQLLLGPNGHLTHRTYSLGQDKSVETCRMVQQALKANQAARFFVGHTKTESGRVDVICNQAVLNTYTGLHTWRGEGPCGQAIVRVTPAVAQQKEAIVVIEQNPTTHVWEAPRSVV